MLRSAERALACAAIIGIAGCGSGGRPPSSSLPNAPSSTQKATATFVVKIPAKGSSPTSRRGVKPHFLTPAVEGISFSVVQQPATLNQGTVFYALTPQSSYCTGGGASPLICTLDVQAPPGNDVFTVDTYDATSPGGGYITSTATLTQQINAQSANTIAITTEGVVSYIGVAIDDPFPATGPAQAVPVRVIAADADGYQIVGPFDSPLSLTDSDSSGSTTLSNAGPASSSDLSNLTMAWDGTALASPATITVSAQSAADGNNGGPFSATSTFSPGVSGAYAPPSSLTFAHVTSGAQTIAVTGVNTTGPFTVTSDGCVSVSGSGPAFTITPVSATGVFSPCNISVSGASGASSSVPVLVSP